MIRRKIDKKYQRKKVLAKLAMAPATINMTMVLEQARGIFGQCLDAIYKEDPEILPMEHMEREIYNYLATQIQAGNLHGVVDSPVPKSFSYVAKDNSIMYAISSVTFCAECAVNGIATQLLLHYSIHPRTGITLSDIQITHSADEKN